MYYIVLVTLDNLHSKNINIYIYLQKHNYLKTWAVSQNH